MKQCDLEKIYSKLASQVPVRTDGNEAITLSSHNLPLPPSEIVTSELYIEKWKNSYNIWYVVDSLHFYASKETYRHLGLLILSVLFHTEVSQVNIKLNHPHSHIKSLIIDFDSPDIDGLMVGYTTQPLGFNYYAHLTEKHPFDSCVLPQDLPCFELSNSKNLYFTDEDWQQRDTVTISGNDTGLAAFAELLLNFSVPHSELDEIQLEGESGFRGVGISSAEVRLWLPGSFGWMEEHWQED